MKSALLALIFSAAAAAFGGSVFAQVNNPVGPGPLNPPCSVFGTASGQCAQGGAVAAGGPTGSATAAPIITYNAAGQLTAVTSATVTPAVGSITGLGAGVATLLAGSPSGTGGVAGKTSPTFSGSLTLSQALSGGSLTALVNNSASAVNTNAIYELVTGTANSYAQYALADNNGAPYLIESGGSAVSTIYRQYDTQYLESSAGVVYAKLDSTGLTLTTLSADTAATDASLCARTSDNLVLKGTGTLGICLGTSSARYKHDITPLGPGLAEIMGLKPISYKLNADHGDPDKTLYGFTAEQGGKVLPALMTKDAAGKPNTFDYLGVVPVLVKAVQEQEAEIAALKAEIADLEVPGVQQARFTTHAANDSTIEHDGHGWGF